MGLGGEGGVAGEFHPVTIGFELQLIPGWLLTVYRFPLYLFQTGLLIPFLKSQLLHVACKGHTGLLLTGGCRGQIFPGGFPYPLFICGNIFNGGIHKGMGQYMFS